MSRLAPAPRSALRAVAVATLVAFGCATTREPLPPPPPAPPVERVYFEDPEMELWVEGAGSVDPAESQRAQAESRAALQAAIDGRGVPAAEAEAVLVLRERAVVRTAERRSNQALATAGIVVGVVAVVAVVVVALVAGKGKGGASSGAPRPGGHATAPAPGAAVAAAPRAAVPAGAAAAAAPRAAAVGGAAASAQTHPTAPAPPPGAPTGPVHPAEPAPPPGTIVARPVPIPPPPPPPPPVDIYLNYWAPQPYPAWVPPPPLPFSVKDRGFFDPDEVLLEMALLDARTGAILWGAAVRGWADPRHRTEVAKLVETALGGQPWARRAGARPPPAPPAPAEPPPAG